MFDLDAFISECRRLAGGAHGPKLVLDLMRASIAEPESVAKAVAPQGPGVGALDAPLFRSPELTVLNVALRPGTVTIPHDHRMWAVIGIYQGEEANTFFKRDGAGLAQANRRTIRSGEAILLGEDVVHAIENPLGAETLGLHVYGGDLLGAPRSMWDPRESREHPYDVPQFYAWSRELAASRKTSARAAAAT